MKALTIALTVIANYGAIGSRAAAVGTAATSSIRDAERERVERILRAQEIAACCESKLSLPLDHGPRADSTPWLNEPRVWESAAKSELAQRT